MRIKQELFYFIVAKWVKYTIKHSNSLQKKHKKITTEHWIKKWMVLNKKVKKDRARVIKEKIIKGFCYEVLDVIL